MDERPQLTARASAGERTDVRTPDASGTTVNLSDAVARFGVSRATLRRKLHDGEIAGAHKVPGPKGDEWRLPIAGLLALGYRDRAEEEAAAATPVPPAPELLDLTATIRALTETLEGERRALMAAEEHRHDAEREREEARVAQARAETELAAERALRERIEADLERARSEQPRRRWFVRGT
jgi:hypothetical protein